MSNTYTKEEVAKHKTKNDCWLIMNNKVYDVTKFIADHPGGEIPLLDHAGKDATEAFIDIGHGATATTLREKFLIGTVGSSSSAPVAVAATPAPAPTPVVAPTPVPQPPPPSVRAVPRDFDEAKNLSVTLPTQTPASVPSTPLPPAPAPPVSQPVASTPYRGSSTVYIKSNEDENKKGDDTELYLVCGGIMITALAYVTYAKFFRQSLSA